MRGARPLGVSGPAGHRTRGLGAVEGLRPVALWGWPLCWAGPEGMQSGCWSKQVSSVSAEGQRWARGPLDELPMPAVGTGETLHATPRHMRVDLLFLAEGMS